MKPVGITLFNAKDHGYEHYQDGDDLITPTSDYAQSEMTDMERQSTASSRYQSEYADDEVTTDFRSVGVKATADFRSNAGQKSNRGSLSSFHAKGNFKDDGDGDNDPYRESENLVYEDDSKLKQFWNSKIAIVLGTLIGIGCGILLNSQKNIDSNLAEWIALPGDLFLRALKCLVLPMVFFSLACGMADIISAGKASVIGWRMAVLFFITTTAGATTGVLMGVAFKPLFTQVVTATVESKTIIAVKCPNGQFLEVNKTQNNQMTCTGTDPSFKNTTQANKNDTEFELLDLNNLFTKKKEKVMELTISDQLLAIFEQFVPSNIVKSLANGRLLSVVTFALIFGVAIAYCASALSGNTLRESGKLRNPFLDLMRQLNVTFMLMIHWVISLTPIAVISLIAGSFARNSDKMRNFNDALYLALAHACCIAIHAGLTLPTLLFIFTKSNPYAYLRFMLPAQLFAFSCASSAATLPITLRCIDSTRTVSRQLSRFVVSIGSTVNMDGSAMWMGLAVSFLARTSGFDLDAFQICLLALITILGSIGLAPVPNSSLVMLGAVWATVVSSSSGLPPSFNYIVAMDWLMDRWRTPVNVTSDTIIARIIASQVDETMFHDDENDYE